MLKLRKTSQLENSIGIMMRDKEPYFTPALRIGFLIAISFHLLFVFVFHIVPFSLPFNSYVFPPITVETPLLQDGTAIAAAEKILQVSPDIPLRPLTELTKTALPISVAGPSLKLDPVLTDRNIKIERDLHTFAFGPFRETTVPHVKVIVGKELADRYRPLEMAVIIPSQDTRGVYAIIVEDRTGSIIWSEPISALTDPQLQRYAVKALQQMRFSVQENTFVSEGVIELHFFKGV